MSDTPRRYTGQGIEISYDVHRCIHAAECVRGLPAVFDTARRPWIQPDGAPADTIANVVACCPTGALHATRLDGGPEEVPPTPAVVRAVPDGPLYVQGHVRLQRNDGSLIVEETRLALCRCGQSRNKPFCDNSHRAAGFTAGGDVPVGDETMLSDGPLVVIVRASGPLLLRGPFTLCGTGEATYAGSRAALCRCGGSSTKPLCDGTHRRNGFATRGSRMGNDCQDEPVRDNPAQRRYEMAVGDRIGLIAYRLAGDTITFIHTEVPEELEGRGIASRMARFALDDARARGLRVVLMCPFVAAYIRRHPEYQDLVIRRIQE